MSCTSKKALREIGSGEREPQVTYAGSFRDLHFQIRRIVSERVKSPDWPYIGPESHKGEQQ